MSKLQPAVVPPLIRLVDVRRTYQVGDTAVNALDGVDLEIHRGEFVAIIGPSGSGKSTLMYLLGCLDSPTSGRYELEGVDISRAPDHRLSEVRNRTIGYVFQAYNLLPGLPVVDNIALGMVYAGTPIDERREVASTLAKSLGLGHRLDHTARELSGGQMQRVAIARGLAASPHLLLADEPTGNLDTKTGAEIMRIFRDLHAKGTTVVLVTHDPGVAAQADRAIRIVDGRIVADERKVLGAPSASSAETYPTNASTSVAQTPGAPASRPAEVPATITNTSVPQHASAGLEAGAPRGDAPGVSWADLLRMAAHEGLLAHQMRTALTMLGIVFGIAAVIAMTAITEGGREEQLKTLRQIGQNSIQVKALDLEGTRLARVRRLNPDGLTLADHEALKNALGPELSASTAWKQLRAELKIGGRNLDWATVLGISGDFQGVLDFRVGSGRFLDDRDNADRRRVVVLGHAVAKALFPEAPPLGQTILVGDEPFTVVGVMAPKAFTGGGVGDVSSPDRNREAYLPYESLRAYFRRQERDSRLDAISLRMATDAGLAEQGALVQRMVSELHHGADDLAVSVPLAALKQAQRTKEVFNVIIIVIAGISLVVGGIGIMNIMLASVTERTREIGVRRAVGASRRDILRQFLTEAVLIAACGAVVGLALGFAAGWLIEAVFAFPVAFRGWVAAMATASSAGIGIGFGLYPAWKAARMDPVEALRA